MIISESLGVFEKDPRFSRSKAALHRQFQVSYVLVETLQLAAKTSKIQLQVDSAMISVNVFGPCHLRGVLLHV